MSYQEKKTLAILFAEGSMLAAYCIHAFGKYNSGAVPPGDLKFWAGTMLAFVGIGIGMVILILIIFHIFLSVSIAAQKKLQDGQTSDNEIERSIKVEMMEDERDKLVELKSTRIGSIVTGFGLVAGLVSLVLGASAVVMLNIVFIFFYASSLFEGASQLYQYRRGG